MSLVIRTITTLLLAGMFYGVSVWLKNTTNLMFLVMCILVVPMLFDGTFLLFTHSGLLCGTGMLMLLGQSEISLAIPLGTVVIYSCIVVFLAEKRHRLGV